MENPLGARAIYLGSSEYRIHGSNEPETIGTAVSSGCIRMTNRDVIDLYFTDPSGIQPKQKILAILRQHLAEADQKIGALQQFRADLQTHIERFERWFEETEHR